MTLSVSLSLSFCVFVCVCVSLSLSDCDYDCDCDRLALAAVPMYGVLTKRDKVDVTSTAFLDTKKRFMQHLGLNQSRFLLCSNYCDDLDHAGLRTQQLSPELDLPYVYFMHKVQSILIFPFK